MASFIQAQVQGLSFSNNVYTAAQPGSLARANNVEVNSSGLLESRRGFRYWGEGFGASAADTANSIGFLGPGDGDPSSFAISYGSTGKLAHTQEGSSSDFSGTYYPVNDDYARMRFCQAAGNVYMNTNVGTKVIPGGYVTASEGGVPPGLLTTGFNISSGTWQTYNTSVAYRHSLVRTDLSGNRTEGIPSGRFILPNRILAAVGGVVRTGGVTCTVTLPAGSPHYLNAPDTVTLISSDALFTTGTVVTLTGTPTATSFTFNLAGANGSSTTAIDFSKARGASIYCHLPPDAITGDVINIYRSDMTAASGDTASDELFLAGTITLSDADIAFGYAIFTDYQPESLLGSFLYTNPSQGGLIEGNNRPPIALDLTYWNDRLCAANTVQRHTFTLTILGVTAPDGLQNNWTITIADKTYTAKTTPVAATDFQVVTTLSTPTLNLAATADALIAKVNSQSTLVVAYNISDPEDGLATILIEERAIGGSAFSVSATNSGASQTYCFEPQLPTVPSFTVESSNNTQTNGISFSKLGQPGSFQLAYDQQVGPANCQLLREIGLGDYLYAFTDAGLYTLSGSQPPFRSRKMAELRIVGADTACTLGEAVYALTDQGVVRINESGVTVVSRSAAGDIESALTDLYGDALTNVRKLAFAVAHESKRQYILYLPSSADSTYCDQAYVYNTATKAWTRSTVSATCGIHDPIVDVVMLGDSDLNTLLVQRNEKTADDYRDPEFAVTISSSSSYDVVLSSVTGISEGDQLIQGDSRANVESIDTDTNTLTLNTVQTWTAATATIYPSIDCDVVWNPVTAGNPALGKSFYSMSVMFQESNLSKSSWDFSSEVNPIETVELSSPGFGESEFGYVYGDPEEKLKLIKPVPVGICAQLTIGMRIREAGASWKLAGFTLELNQAAGKVGRD